MVGTKIQRRLSIAAAAAMLLAGSMLPGQAADVTAAGLWQRSDNGRPVVWVLMLDRGNGLFEGVVAKTFAQPGVKPIEICDECEDDRKDQPVLGISLIRDMKRKGLEYLDGNILDPRNGDVWKAQLKVSPDGQVLTLRGYLMTPMLGKDENWQRLPDTAYAQLDPAITAKFLPAQAAALQPGQPGKPAAPTPAAMQSGKPAPAATTPVAKPKTVAPAQTTAPAPASAAR
jgi:uncharacterized protein (DUF2147 family)